MLREIVENTETKYTVVLLGGSIGERRAGKVQELKGQSLDQSELVSVVDTYEEAMEKKQRMNKLLSPGEKKHYGLKYVVAGVINGKFTGKGK